MESSLLIALSRQTTLKREMASVANNIANMNTHAYKGEKMMFVDHLVRSKSDNSLIGDKLAFVRDLAQFRDLSEGKFEETGNPLDVAIHGEGYFVVETPAGNRYTRNGHFQLNSEGVLTNSDGHPVLTEDGDKIETTPGNSQFEITRTGTINTDNGPIGKLAVVEFQNPQEMKKTSGSLLSSEEAGTQAEVADVLQGKLEGSNVQPIIEMTRMINVHRSYENAKKLVDKEDERIKKAISLISDR